MLKDFGCSINYHPGKAKVVVKCREQKVSRQFCTHQYRKKNKSCKLIDQGLQLKVIEECILPRFRVRLVHLNKVKAA